MKILKIGSQVEKRSMKVYIYKRTKVMALVIEYRALSQSLTRFSTPSALRVSGRNQTYNDLYWL